MTGHLGSRLEPEHQGKLSLRQPERSQEPPALIWMNLLELEGHQQLLTWAPCLHGCPTFPILLARITLKQRAVSFPFAKLLLSPATLRTKIAGDSKEGPEAKCDQNRRKGPPKKNRVLEGEKNKTKQRAFSTQSRLNQLQRHKRSGRKALKGT